MHSLHHDELHHLRITPHAADTMERRGVSMEVLAAALVHPDATERLRHGGRDTLRVVHDGLVYILARDAGRPVLITVLLRDAETWTDAEALTRRRADPAAPTVSQHSSHHRRHRSPTSAPRSRQGLA